MRVGAGFHEMLHLRRASAGWTLFAVSIFVGVASLALLGGVLSSIGVVVALLLAIGTWFAGTETTITSEEIRLVMRPYPRARRIPLADVVEAEIVFADANTTFFGGWEGSRGGLGGALAESVEGPRSVGNRSIRLHLSDGRMVQFATWRPHQALAAIRASDPA